jgi:Flp pilus assembly protein TadG
MDTRLRTFFQNQDGAVILETALMLTIILLVTFGMVDFGRVMYTSNNLISAAREGARFGAVENPGPSPGVSPAGVTAIKAVVRNRFNLYTFGGDTLKDTNIDVDTSSTSPPTFVKVSIKYKFTWISPVAAIASIIGNSKVTYTDSLHSQATFRYEAQ